MVIAALSVASVAGLWPTAAKAQVIVGYPQPVVVIEQPPPAYGTYPVFTYGAPFGFDSFGALPPGFTFGPPIPPQGYYDWAGGPPPPLDIGTPVGLPVTNGLEINSPFVINPTPPTAPAPPPSAVPAPPAPPAIPDSAFIQHGPALIIVKVGRTEPTRTTTKQQTKSTKSKSSPTKHQTAGKKKPSS
jgi:hypothetical protein